MSNSSIWPTERTLSGATPPSQSVPENNGNKGVFHIPQISKSRVSSSDGLILYLRHWLRRSYPSAEMQLVYSTAPANWADIYVNNSIEYTGAYIIY